MTLPVDQVKALHEAGLFGSAKLLVSLKSSTVSSNYLGVNDSIVSQFFAVFKNHRYYFMPIVKVPGLCIKIQIILVNFWNVVDLN